MPYHFNPGKYQNTFDNMFGKGSFNSGISQSQRVGRLKVQADFAQKDYLARLRKAQQEAAKQQREAEAAAKKAAEQAKYNNIFKGTKVNKNASKQIDAMIRNPKQKGAVQNAEAIRNDPSLQAELKKRGYAVDKFINSMYNAASNGRFKSERQYNKYVGYLNKQNAPYRKANDASIQAVIDRDKAKAAAAKQKAAQAKQRSNSLLAKIQRFSSPLIHGIKDIGSEIGQGVKATEQAINPFDKVSANQAIRGWLNHKQSKTVQETNRFANRVLDSYTAHAMSNLDKKVNNRTPSYTSIRPIGKGGGIDMAADALGFLGPGALAYKAVNASKVGNALARFGAQSTGKRLLAESAKGALTGAGLTGADIGIKEGFNPKGQNWKQNLKEFGIGVGTGAIGDPALYGLSKGLNLKGQLNGLLKDTKTKKYSPEEFKKALHDTFGQKGNPINTFADHKSKMPSYKTPIKPLSINAGKPNYKITSFKIKPVDAKTAAYQKEFKNVVKNHYNYLKNSMGKGVDYGTTSNGLGGNFKEVNGSFSVSRNPKWYQDFYAQNGRKPNDSELKIMAKDHVLNGFKDEFGSIPAYTPKNVQEIDNQINQVNTMLRSQPDQAPALNPILKALEQDRKTSLNEFKQAVSKPSMVEPVTAPLQSLKLNSLTPKSISKQSLKVGRDYEAIGAAPKGNGGKLLRADSLPQNQFNYPYKPGDPLPDTRTQIGTKTQREIPTIGQAANTGYIKGVDNLHRLSQFDNQVSKVLGRNLKASESTHTLGLNSRGSDMVSKQALTEKMINKNGEVIGPSLKDITMKIPKGKLKDFEDYIINKHAITRMNRGEKVFPDSMQMSPAKSKAIVNNYEQQYPQFKDLAKEYYNYNKQLGQNWLVDMGILSKDQWEGYLKANPYYVPNNRVFSKLEQPKFANSAKRGFANQTNPVKKATGSQRQIVSPIESTIEHTAQYIKTAKRNEVMQTLIKHIQQDPEAFAGWAEIVPTDKAPQSVMDSLNKNGVDGLLEELDKGFKQKPDLTKGNIIRGLVDGKPVHVRVNDLALLDALTNLQPKAQNFVIDALGQVTRVMKNLTTGINPVFSLTRNIFRDIPTAYVNSKSANNPLTFSKDLVQAIVSVMRNDKLYRSFKAVGGGHSSPISTDVNLLAQSKRSILPGEKGFVNSTRRIGGKLIGGLENLNNAVEAAPRLAEFKRLAGNSYDSKMKALYEANDVTVNFNKYGNIAKEIDQVVPYFNAAVQGLDKQWRVFFSKSATPKQKIAAVAKAFVGITIPSIIMYDVNHNDPNYQKLSNYIKDSNILIPKGDGTFYKIPKPRELGTIFGSGVERVLRSWQDQDPNAFQDFMTTIKDNFLPPVRTTVDPFNDLRANKNFMGIPIIPTDLQNLPAKYQYDSKTSEVSKKLGNIFGFSPMKADYLVKSYGGVLGQLGIPATSKDNTVGSTLMQQVTADPVFSNDLQRRFYETKTKLDQAHNALSKQGVVTPDLNEPLRLQLNRVSTQMGKLRKQMKQVQNDSSLTRQQRLDNVRKLQDMINNLAAQANQNVR